MSACLAAAALAGCGDDGGTSAPVTPSGSCDPLAPVTGTPRLTARRVASGLRSPLDLQTAGGDTERLYVVEQAGRIRILRDGTLQPEPFLDIAGRVGSGGERGLLGLAFHPQFATNRRLFVNYTDLDGDTHIAEFRATDADHADPASERTLLLQPQPYQNHNGGGVAFGRDGRLYVGLGDGGSGGDPHGYGQSLDTLLGKMLRLDVDGAAPYAIPNDNPFRSRSGARPEIWAYGLRNPFRFSFDAANGDLYIGDVGQNEREELDVGLVTQRGGENYGWNVMEGSACYFPATGCDRAGLTLPIYDYGHGEGCSVTGGVVYRGCRMPDLAGTYFFGDFCSGFVRSLRYAGGQVADVREWPLTGINLISSFGTDAYGEMYVVDFDGEIYRLEPAS